MLLNSKDPLLFLQAVMMSWPAWALQFLWSAPGLHHRGGSEHSQKYTLPLPNWLSLEAGPSTIGPLSFWALRISDPCLWVLFLQGEGRKCLGEREHHPNHQHEARLLAHGPRDASPERRKGRDRGTGYVPIVHGRYPGPTSVLVIRMAGVDRGPLVFFSFLGLSMLKEGHPGVVGTVPAEDV